MTGWVHDLLLQLQLCFASAVFLGCKSRNIYDYGLVSHLTLPQPGVPGFRKRTGWPKGYGGGILTLLHKGYIDQTEFFLDNKHFFFLRSENFIPRRTGTRKNRHVLREVSHNLLTLNSFREHSLYPSGY
jgi:hypothetical protein